MADNKKVFKLITGALALSLAVLLVPLSAAFGEGGFRAGNIISDANMYQANPSMSQAEIQKFLDTQGASCKGNDCLKNLHFNTHSFAADRYCPGAYQGANNEPVSQIIYKVSQACHINPKVLLVTIQKEQSGLTRNLTEVSQRTLMGYGCPDGRPCKQLYYGVQNQIYRAARQFQLYRLRPGDYSFRAGITPNILFSYQSDCGSSKVTLENQATASLYNYTPYQPNQALLSGGRDSCSSDGNYNFFNMYSKWFGDPRSSAPAAPASNPISVPQGGNTGSSSSTKAQAAKEQPNILQATSANPTSAQKSASATATNPAPNAKGVSSPAATNPQSASNPKPAGSTQAAAGQNAAAKVAEADKAKQAALAAAEAKRKAAAATQAAQAAQTKSAAAAPQTPPQPAESAQLETKLLTTSPQAKAESKPQTSKPGTAATKAKTLAAKPATSAAKSSNNPALASTGTIGGSVTLLAIALVIAGWRIRKSVIDNRPIRVNC